jgi:hypothetical protein
VKKPNLKKLGEFVKKRMQELRLTDRDVADSSKGYASYGTVNGLTGAKNNDIQLGSLYGIALGIGVPKEHLVALAFDEDPYERELLTVEEQDLVTRLRRLPFETQTCILEIIRAVYTQELTRKEVGHSRMREQGKKSGSAKKEPDKTLINLPLTEIDMAVRKLFVRLEKSDIPREQVVPALVRSIETMGDQLLDKPGGFRVLTADQWAKEKEGTGPDIINRSIESYSPDDE